MPGAWASLLFTMRSRYDISDLVSQDRAFLDEVSADFAQGLEALSSVLPAVTVYGSSRVPAGDPVYKQAEDLAQRLACQGYSVITGGGPGVMEAANKGARDAGGVSVGINVWFPDEQPSNPYATLSLQIQHLFVRKILLVRYASAVVFLPGGYGTLDEFFETLTLIQTERLRPVPVILLGKWYWKTLAKWIRTVLAERGLIRPHDEDAFRVVDTVDDAVKLIGALHYGQPAPTGKGDPPRL